MSDTVRVEPTDEVKRLRHFGKWQRDDVVVVGWQARTGLCVVCTINRLPVEDQFKLRELVRSERAQKEDSLSLFLERMPHRRGGRWWTYMMLMMHRGHGVRQVRIKDITDLHPQQSALIKGYGKSSKALEVEAKRKVVEAEKKAAEEAQKTQPKSDPALIAVLGQLAQRQSQIMTMMAAIMEQKEPKKRGRKPKTESVVA